MFVTLFTTWNFWDLDQPEGPTIPKIEVAPGRYEVERVPNPWDEQGEWIIIKGTRIGAREDFLRALSDELDPQLRILFEDEQRLDSPEALAIMNARPKSHPMPWEED